MRGWLARAPEITPAEFVTQAETLGFEVACHHTGSLLQHRGIYLQQNIGPQDNGLVRLRKEARMQKEARQLFKRVPRVGKSWIESSAYNATQSKLPDLFIGA